MMHLFILSIGLFIAAVIYTAAVLKHIYDEIKKDQRGKTRSPSIDAATNGKIFCDEDFIHNQTH